MVLYGNSLEINMEVKIINGRGINVSDEGNKDGPAFVLANSLGTDLRIWDRFLQNFPQRYRVIRFDKRGHGLSDISKNDFSIEGLASDIIEILDDKQISDCVFVGVSIGGLIGLQVVLNRPDLVKALVFSNSSAKVRDEAFWNDRIKIIEKVGLDAVGDSILEKWFSKEFRKNEAEELLAWRNMLIRTPQRGYLDCCRVLKHTDLRERLGEVKVDTLAISGSEDGAIPPEEVIEGTIGLPNATHETIVGSGHLPCIEKPLEFRELIFSFLLERGLVNRN